MNIKQLNTQLETLAKAKKHIMKSKKSLIKHTQGDEFFNGYLRNYDKTILDIEQIEAVLQLWIADIKGEL